MRQFICICGVVSMVMSVTLTHTLADKASDPLGSPLFLSPYIEKGDIAGGKAAAKVASLIEGDSILSYSGYLTVNSSYNSNLFFWFFPAENSPSNASVVLWLQGGPGTSSLFGLFYENGPFGVVEDLTLQRRSTYWSQEFNMIFIDNPVGTGFSFTDNIAGYATDEIQVGTQLYSAMYQFFQLFPEFKNNDFFLTGESYAGKYIPALGYTIHTKNPTAKFPIKLKGIAIGNGWVDPIHMQQFSDYLFEIGLIDVQDKEKMKSYEIQCVRLLQDEKYYDALTPCDEVLDVFYNASGIISAYNYAHISDDDDLELFDPYIVQPQVRKNLHVGDKPYNDGHEVSNALRNDTYKSVAPWLEMLMDNYRVLLYSGQLDIMVAYPLTVNMVRNMKWKGSTDYASAVRKLWVVNNEPAGFFKTIGNFTEVMVRNAGHMVPSDQPVWALDLISRFVRNIPLDYEFK